ncbi:hypothetical protein [Streptomyces sp. NPDC047525]|uniref:hypothetical protein n=1 Tax=Streptomyces sp. NPDC047525 TaxID=3155264 RepID=UPI0033FA7B20
MTATLDQEIAIPETLPAAIGALGATVAARVQITAIQAWGHRVEAARYVEEIPLADGLPLWGRATDSRTECTVDGRQVIIRHHCAARLADSVTATVDGEPVNMLDPYGYNADERRARIAYAIHRTLTK